MVDSQSSTLPSPTLTPKNAAEGEGDGEVKLLESDKAAKIGKTTDSTPQVLF